MPLLLVVLFLVTLYRENPPFSWLCFGSDYGRASAIYTGIAVVALFIFLLEWFNPISQDPHIRDLHVEERFQSDLRLGEYCLGLWVSIQARITGKGSSS